MLRLMRLRSCLRVETSGLMPGCRAVGVANEPAWSLLCYTLVWVYPTELGSFIP